MLAVALERLCLAHYIEGMSIHRQGETLPHRLAPFLAFRILTRCLSPFGSQV